MSDKYIRLAGFFGAILIISALTSKYIVSANMEAIPSSQVLIADYSSIVRAMPKSATRMDIERAYDIYNEAIDAAKNAGYLVLSRDAALAFDDRNVLKMPEPMWVLFEEIANRDLQSYRGAPTPPGNPNKDYQQAGSSEDMQFQMSVPTK